MGVGRDFFWDFKKNSWCLGKVVVFEFWLVNFFRGWKVLGWVEGLRFGDGVGYFTDFLGKNQGEKMRKV